MRRNAHFVLSRFSGLLIADRPIAKASLAGAWARVGPEMAAGAFFSDISTQTPQLHHLRSCAALLSTLSSGFAIFAPTECESREGLARANCLEVCGIESDDIPRHILLSAESEDFTHVNAKRARSSDPNSRTFARRRPLSPSLSWYHCNAEWRVTKGGHAGDCLPCNKSVTARLTWGAGRRPRGRKASRIISVPALGDRCDHDKARISSITPAPAARDYCTGAAVTRLFCRVRRQPETSA